MNNHYKINWMVTGENCNIYEYNIVKYLIRYQYKGKPIEDIKKALDYAEVYLTRDVKPSKSISKEVIDSIVKCCKLNESIECCLYDLLVLDRKEFVPTWINLLISDLKEMKEV